MKNISDLANSLQENMQQEAENSKRIVKSVLDDLVNDIRNYTSESTRLIKNAIDEQNRQSRRLLLNSCLTFVLLSLAAVGLILYLGEMIDDRWDTIRTQNKTIQNLKDQTFGIDLRELKDGRFITLPKNQKIETGWWVGEHQAIKLLDPEE